uniref:hypothetical protein n=1 Tax=Cupriavidus yeoncheonensis TaxID=1462994 RepID=UPI003F49237C
MVWTTDEMVERATTHINDGEFVYLGPGLPAAVASRIPKDAEVWLHVHDGVPGFMHYPTDDFMDAGFIAGGARQRPDTRYKEIYHSTDSFAEMTSVSMDLAILDASGEHGDRIEMVRWAIGSGAKQVVLLLGALRGIRDVTDLLASSRGDGVSYRVISDQAVIDVTDQGVAFVEGTTGVTPAEIEKSTSLQFS